MLGRVNILFALILFASITISAAESSEGDKPDSTTGTLLTKAGLDHLSKEDQEKVIGLIDDAVESTHRTDKKTTDIADRAVKYFEAEGFKVLYLKIVSVKGEDWLVVSSGLTTFATKDLPFMLPTSLFKEGYYFCKPAIMGGITEMIDDSGRKQSFFLVEWKNLD